MNAPRCPTAAPSGPAPSRGLYLTSGNGASRVPVDIGHDSDRAIIDPQTAFWALIKKHQLAAQRGNGTQAKVYAENLLPCSELVGAEACKGGNLFEDEIDQVLKTEAFLKVTEQNETARDPTDIPVR